MKHVFTILLGLTVSGALIIPARAQSKIISIRWTADQPNPDIVYERADKTVAGGRQAAASCGATIDLGLDYVPFCAGSLVTYPFAAMRNPCGINTTDPTAIELSDAVGNFTNPTIIANVIGEYDAYNYLITIRTPGKFAFKLPSDLPAGTGYLVRINNAANGPSNGVGPFTILAAPNVSITPSATTLCAGQSAQLVASGANFYTWSSGQTVNPISVTVSDTYSVTGVASNGCSGTATAVITVPPLPLAPTLVTAGGYPYPAGQTSLTINQNVGPVILTALGCNGGQLTANGSSASSLTISTALTGIQTYTATCTRNGCTGPAGNFSLTVVPTTLSVLHRDADYGNTQNNIIKPFLELVNAGGQAIPYSEVIVRYWLTAEDNAPPTNFAVYYAPLGTVSMKYVALSQPRQGAYGYIEYSFFGGGSLTGGGNSGPIENGIQKTDGSSFNEFDDYSYQANYADYIPNVHITAYRKGADGIPVIFWGQEPTKVMSQTAVQVYSAARDSPTTSQTPTRLELRNTGNVALSVANLKLRYYFTSDNGKPAIVYVDYADVGAQNVEAQVVRLTPPLNGADSYVELTFPDSSLTINPLSSLGYVDFRIVRSDYGLFSQTNDYSYAANYGNVELNNHITAYLNNNLVFGAPPSGALARAMAPELISALSVRILDNPVMGTQAQVEIRGAEGQTVNLQLIDLQGRAVHERRIEPSTAVESVSMPIGSSRGMLLLKVSTASQHQQVKLLRP